MCALRFLVLTLTLVIITSSQSTEFNNGQCPQSDIAVHEMTEENKELKHEVQRMRAELTATNQKIATVATDIKEILTEVQATKKSCFLCPSEFLYRNVQLRSCYFFSKTKKTWANASDECIRRGAYLVEVDSKEEDDFLRGIIMTGSEIFHWMGSNDLLKEGQWMWHQSGKPFTYTNWLPGQPDNSDGKEHCLMYWTDSKWNDASCNYPFLYICEIHHT